MAREALGMDKRLPKTAAPRDLGRIEALPNVRRAAELAAIGWRSQAEELLRHQAKIGSPADHRALVRDRRQARTSPAPNSGSLISASRVRRSMPPTAIRCRTGRPTMAGGSIRRWPMPTSSRNRNFRTDAVSPAGAVGLMQVRPGTAGDTARSRGTSVSAAIAQGSAGQHRLWPGIHRADPRQARPPAASCPRSSPPIMPGRCRSSAGPITTAATRCCGSRASPIGKPASTCPSVLRNMWVIQGLKGEQTPTLTSLAQHKWPDFPTRADRERRRPMVLRESGARETAHVYRYRWLILLIICCHIASNVLVMFASISCACRSSRSGRGATRNATPTRFNLKERVADGDWLDSVESLDGDRPAPDDGDGRAAQDRS